MSELCLQLMDEDGEDLPDLLGSIQMPVTLDRFDHDGPNPIFIVCHWYLVDGVRRYLISVMDKAPAVKAFVATRLHNVAVGIDRVLLLAPPAEQTKFEWYADEFMDMAVRPELEGCDSTICIKTTRGDLIYPASQIEYELSYSLSVKSSWGETSGVHG